MQCSPGSAEPCYDGPPNTLGVGLCAGGTRSCDGLGNWGPCTGQTLPAVENCDSFLTDEDCDGAPKNGCPTRVLMVSAAGSTYTDELVAQQSSTGAFAVVAPFNANTGTPTLALLMSYDVALVTSDVSFADPIALGNVIADYYDAGGRVVLVAFATTNAVPIQGRFGDVTQGYMLINPNNGYFSNAESIGQVAEPQSPLMVGVSSISAWFGTNGEPINGGVAVARYVTSAPLVVRGVVKGRNRADLNLYPPSAFCQGNCVELVRNALLFE